MTASWRWIGWRLRFRSQRMRFPAVADSSSTPEWGNPKGPALLFIHGWSQSDLCWLNQVRSDLVHLPYRHLRPSRARSVGEALRA